MFVFCIAEMTSLDNLFSNIIIKHAYMYSNLCMCVYCWKCCEMSEVFWHFSRNTSIEMCSWENKEYSLDSCLLFFCIINIFFHVFFIQTTFPNFYAHYFWKCFCLYFIQIYQLSASVDADEWKIWITKTKKKIEIFSFSRYIRNSK